MGFRHLYPICLYKRLPVNANAESEDSLFGIAKKLEIAPGLPWSPCSSELRSKHFGNVSPPSLHGRPVFGWACGKGTEELINPALTRRTEAEHHVTQRAGLEDHQARPHLRICSASQSKFRPFENVR